MVKINMDCPEDLREELKLIAKSKGMKFHAYLVMELRKIAKKEGKK